MVLVGWLFSLGLCLGGISQFEQSLMQMLASDNQVWSTESLAYISFFFKYIQTAVKQCKEFAL